MRSLRDCAFFVFMGNIEYACAFTGHRKIPKYELKQISRNLKIKMIELYKEGIKTFIAGGALGFDTLAALMVIKMREKFPDVKLVLVLPCKNQTDFWNKDDIKLYNDIKSKSDDIIYISDEYSNTCMFERNRYMIDNSSFCIAYYRFENSGTAYTVEYAKKHGKTVLFL